MTKPNHYHKPFWAWRVSRMTLYAQLKVLGGMADDACTKIKPSFAWQGKLDLGVGWTPWYSTERFEVRVNPAKTGGHRAPHRVQVRCPKCYSWQPFGRLHQHIASQRCLATAEIVSKLPAIPALRSAKS